MPSRQYGSKVREADHGGLGLAGASVASRAERPLVGRGREIDELDGMLARVAGGRGATCLITGEPGIGKTSLARTFAELAADRASILWGSCWERGAAPAYWPWTLALRPLVDDRAAPEVRAAVATDLDQLARVVPELRAGRPVPEQAGDDAGEASRFALFDAIARVLTAGARERPLVVVLDDLHDADAPSIALMEFLARALAAAPVLLVGTAREHEMALRQDVETPLARLGPDTQHFPLRGLESDDVALMARAHGQEVDVEALRERTNGNPFFIDELLKLASAGDPGALPQGVRDTIRRRLSALSADSVDLLGVAAIIGLEFTLATVALAAELTIAETLELLEQPRSLGLVAEVRDPREPIFTFPHALVRETLYEDLPAVRRAERHREVAAALEERFPRLADPHLAEVAHHYARAVAVVGGQPARDFAARAGERAMAQSAWEEAAHHFDTALQMHGLLEPDDERRCDLLLALGRARSRAGELELGHATLREAIGVARELPAVRRFALAAIELGAVGLPPGDVDDEIVELLEEALRLLDDRPTVLRARVLARLAVQLYWSPSSARRDALVAQARAIVERHDDPPATLDILAQIHLATSRPESPERLASLERLLGLAAEIGDPEAEAQIRIWRVAAFIQCGDLRAAAAEVEAFVRLSHRLAQPRWEWYAPMLRGVQALVEGRLDDAERLRDEAGEIGLRVHGSMAPLLLGALLLATRWTQRRLGELVDPVTALADAHPAMPSWRCIRVAALTDAGRHAEARVELERIVTDEGIELRVDTTWLSSCALLADAVGQLQEARAAGLLYAALEPYADRNATVPSGAFVGPVQRHLGVLAAAMGDLDLALEHLAAARATAERGGMRAMLAWIALDEAGVLRARDAAGDRGRALASLTAAQDVARAVGLDVVAGRAEEQLAVQETPAAPIAQVSSTNDAVLRREGDVWTISIGDRRVTVRHTKGLEQLAVLLERPNVEVHAVDLVRGELARGATANAGDDLTVRAAPDEDLGPALDATAKAAYRERVEELRAEIEEAEEFNDPERAARAREELDFIAAELGRAVGLGGRDRRQGSAGERARVNVTRSIRAVLRRVAEHDPLLGQELLSTVRTGTFCVYEPDPRRPLLWRVEDH
jgi:tetratricopeptide (TPR) repeat protein